jgi:hypothetical protein
MDNLHNYVLRNKGRTLVSPFPFRVAVDAVVQIVLGNMPPIRNKNQSISY